MPPANQLQTDERAEDLGPPEPWQIREFPRKLRQAIVDEAKARRMSPGEFATRIFVAARDGGWNGFAGQTTGGSPAPAPVDDICRLAEAAARLAETGEMSKSLRAVLQRGLKEAAKARVPSPRPQQPRLTAIGQDAATKPIAND